MWQLELSEEVQQVHRDIDEMRVAMTGLVRMRLNCWIACFLCPPKHICQTLTSVLNVVAVVDGCTGDEDAAHVLIARSKAGTGVV